jgi:hypothetical protein
MKLLVSEPLIVRPSYSNSLTLSSLSLYGGWSTAYNLSISAKQQAVIARIPLSRCFRKSLLASCFATLFRESRTIVFCSHSCSSICRGYIQHLASITVITSAVGKLIPTFSRSNNVLAGRGFLFPDNNDRLKVSSFNS